MNKQIFLLSILTFVSINSYSQKILTKGDKYYVWANSGLNLRESCSRSAKIITTIPYGEIVTIDSTQSEYNFEAEIFGSIKVKEKWTPSHSIRGYMVKISYKNNEGYVFDGFLSKLKPFDKDKNILELEILIKNDSKIIKEFNFQKEQLYCAETMYGNGSLFFSMAADGTMYFENMYMIPNISFEEGLLIINRLFENENKTSEYKWYLAASKNNTLYFSQINSDMYVASARQMNNFFVFTLEGSN